MIVLASACITSLVRLYYTIRLHKTQDTTYYVALMGLMDVPEIASAFLALSLPVFPKFFQYLNSFHPFSWISISQRHRLGSFKTARYRSSPDQFLLPINQPKKSILWPAEQNSPAYLPTTSLIGTRARDQVPVNNVSKLETGNFHIKRPIQIYTTNQPDDTGMP